MARIDRDNKIHIKAIALDDEQRVKVLSPGMLVTKRFLRNRLALVGLIIIVAMFVFAFVGGIVSPYGEREVFRTYETALKDYAGVSLNKEYQYSDAPDQEFPALAKADMILAINKGETSFTSGNVTYTIIKETENLFRIVKLNEAAKVITVKGISSFNQTSTIEFTDELKEVCSQAIEKKEQSFEFEGTSYVVTQDGKMNVISVAQEVSTVTTMIFSTYSQDTKLSSAFKVAAQKALAANETSFQADGVDYTLKTDDKSNIFYLNDQEYAAISQYSINPIASDVFLNLDFKMAVEEAIKKNETTLDYINEKNETEQYLIQRNNEQYTLKRELSTQVNNTYESP
ncbi:ABC transporter permease, partial [Lachnotalea glycerini]